MFIDRSKVKLYIRPGATDMRKQINGLSVLVQEELKLDVFSSSLFIFCNKNYRRLKVLYWDRNGFCLWLKRLERDKFPWPKNQAEAMLIAEKELRMVLDGIDFWKAHKSLTYSQV